MALIISPELYRKFKDKVMAYTNSRQRYEPGKPSRGLSDAEIAENLGITAEEVMEIRCIAELEAIETSRFFEADPWKQDRYSRARPATDKDPTDSEEKD